MYMLYVGMVYTDTAAVPSQHSESVELEFCSLVFLPVV